MRTYLADIIPKLKRFSEKLDNLTLLTNQHWVVIDELKNSKVVYIFRSNNQLLISQNGIVDKGTWEYLGNNSLLIERNGESFLFRHGFFDSNILALKVDGKEEFAFLVNENNHGGDLNTIDKVLSFLENKYLKIIPESQYIHEIIELKEPQTRSISISRSGLIPVENESYKCGYADKHGRLIIDCKYDRAYDFKEGLGLVYNTINDIDYYGFVDDTGKELIPLKYEFGESFSEGLALVKMNGKFGFIDKNDAIVHPFIFDDADSFLDSKARVRVGHKQYFLNKEIEE